MKYFIITLWLICGLADSRASTLHWQGPQDFVTWLQSRHELNVQEYMDSLDALAQFENRGGVDVTKYKLVANLIDDLALRRFAKLREARDFLGTTEYFETEYPGTLKNKMIDALSDGKDDEFSARIVYHSLGGKSWAPLRQNTEFLIEGFEHRRMLFNKLAGEPETFDSLGSDFTLEQQQSMKRTLEEKWPTLQKEPEAVREKKPWVQNVREVTLTGTQPDKDRSGHPGFTDENRATPWMLGILVLLASAVAVVFIYIKNRRGVRS